MIKENRKKENAKISKVIENVTKSCQDFRNFFRFSQLCIRNFMPNVLSEGNPSNFRGMLDGHVSGKV